MSSAPQYEPRYTVADYQQWQGDWELWNGAAIAMTPSPFARHQWVAGNILAQIRYQLGPGCEDCYVLGETDWIVSSDTVVRPDVAVVCGEFPEKFIERAPVVVVEVLSDSTRDKDQTAKFQLYERLNVRFYLMANPSQQTIDAYTLDPSGHYIRMTATDPLAMPLHGDCILRLTTADCFR